MFRFIKIFIFKKLMSVRIILYFVNKSFEYIYFSEKLVSFVYKDPFKIALSITAYPFAFQESKV